MTTHLLRRLAQISGEEINNIHISMDTDGAAKSTLLQVRYRREDDYGGERWNVRAINIYLPGSPNVYLQKKGLKDKSIYKVTEFSYGSAVLPHASGYTHFLDPPYILQ